MKKKILVTGSAGFIGSNFIRYILKESKEYEVASIDAIKKSSLLHTIYSNNNHTFYMGNLCDSHFVNNVLEIEKPDIIVHFASEEHGKVSSNLEALENLTSLPNIKGIGQFVYASSYSVYGNCAEPVNESSSLRPLRTDSISHVASETVLKSLNKIIGLNYKILRICDVLGPRDNSGIIHSIMSALKNENSLSFPFPGDVSREYMHVQDVCSAIKFLIEKGNDNEAYNISLNWELTDIEMIHEVVNVVNEMEHLDTSKFVKDLGFGEGVCDKHYSINSSKLKELGWKGSWKFKDALIKTVAWYDKNRWFIR